MYVINLITLVDIIVKVISHYGIFNYPVPTNVESTHLLHPCPPSSIVSARRSAEFQALFTQPEIFQSLGFTTLTVPCLTFDFAIDSTAEIMGTQVIIECRCRVAAREVKFCSRLWSAVSMFGLQLKPLLKHDLFQPGHLRF